MRHWRFLLGFGALLPTVGCSHLADVPARYAAATPVAVEAGPVVALPPTVLPGQSLGPRARRRTDAVTPDESLRQSIRARLAWKDLNPADLLETPQPQLAGGRAAPGTTGALPSEAPRRDVR
ncbi:hypothetical protein [Methylobacterium sp. A54F]